MPLVVGIIDVSHHPQLVEMGFFLLTFCLGWLRTVILLMSTSKIAGIIGR
jgi:hypothetical protein